MQNFCSKLVGFLNACMLALLPHERRPFGHALIAEENEITDPSERLRWAAGGMFMSMREFLAKVFADPLAWALGGVFGVGCALLDLHNETRWPHVIAVFGITFLLTLLRPRWAWRWIFLAAVALPVFVLLSGDWGPYNVDRFDVFYGVLPAGLGTLIALGLRKAIHYHRHPPASPDVAA